VDIYTGIILISLIVYIAVGNYAGRRVKKLTPQSFQSFNKIPTGCKKCASIGGDMRSVFIAL
jgi:hypothetical protein